VFIPSIPIQANHLPGATLFGRLQALPTNVRKGLKGMWRTNTLPYYENLWITAVNLFVLLGRGLNVIKLLYPLLMNFCNKLEFVPDMLFQLSLIFEVKFRSLPWSGTHERCFTCIGSDHTNKHYTKQEKLAMEKHSSLLQKSYIRYIKVL
jgi:hypothetical protein